MDKWLILATILLEFGKQIYSLFGEEDQSERETVSEDLITDQVQALRKAITGKCDSSGNCDQ